MKSPDWLYKGDGLWEAFGRFHRLKPEVQREALDLFARRKEAVEAGIMRVRDGAALRRLDPHRPQRAPPDRPRLPPSAGFADQAPGAVGRGGAPPGAADSGLAPQGATGHPDERGAPEATNGHEQAPGTPCASVGRRIGPRLANGHLSKGRWKPKANGARRVRRGRRGGGAGAGGGLSRPAVPPDA